jgi:hypothetical protein
MNQSTSWTRNKRKNIIKASNYKDKLIWNRLTSQYIYSPLSMVRIIRWWLKIRWAQICKIKRFLMMSYITLLLITPAVWKNNSTTTDKWAASSLYLIKTRTSVSPWTRSWDEAIRETPRLMMAVNFNSRINISFLCRFCRTMTFHQINNLGSRGKQPSPKDQKETITLITS